MQFFPPGRQVFYDTMMGCHPHRYTPDPCQRHAKDITVRCEGFDHIIAPLADQFPKRPQAFEKGYCIYKNTRVRAKGPQVNNRKVIALQPLFMEIFLIIEKHSGHSMPMLVKPVGLIQQNLLCPAHSHLCAEKQDGNFGIWTSKILIHGPPNCNQLLALSFTPSDYGP